MSEVTVILEERNGITLVVEPHKTLVVELGGLQGPPGTGKSTLDTLNDVNPAGKADGGVLMWVASEGKYRPKNELNNILMDGGNF
jgi:hypothetical protein